VSKQISDSSSCEPIQAFINSLIYLFILMYTFQRNLLGRAPSPATSPRLKILEEKMKISPLS